MEALLNKLIKSDFLEEITDNQAILKEDGKSEFLKLEDLPSNAILFKYDKVKGKDHLPFFIENNISNIRKCSDYLLFLVGEDKIQVITFELKEGETNGYQKQIINAHYLAKHILLLISSAHEKLSERPFGIKQVLFYSVLVCKSLKSKRTPGKPFGELLIANEKIKLIKLPFSAVDIDTILVHGTPSVLTVNFDLAS